MMYFVRVHLITRMLTKLSTFITSTPLHSTMQGDVGGGHYYAYIRPSGAVGMDYEAFAEHVRSTGPPSSSQNQKVEGENGKESEAESSKKQKEKTKEVKESLDALARNGQWLKFNDETVMKVT